ncbi:anti-phage deoxyguanosine triphosphatase [Neptunicella marina]|uniref:Deoxyguanosinetriphosphate triphosphohydrolase-like protein n=1 Tax=Neptunicella marina TaxID=2125989 RepID=A0A8J6IR13_9ALTE|nr:anti-phage deoxyguanosine triphosphatase [Neptunicella marina]MBC3764262.1 deoxyguanosinetriphosphate triphosphohydrolase family protein [Neptunicella marina]
MHNYWIERFSDKNPSRDNDHRTPYQRDKARVLHSAAFRRLQAKTQVLSVGANDFHRTRLTHSLEAAQIGQGIAAQLQQKQPELTEELQLDFNLIETLCLAHDIGHPPFGHGGEAALHFMMRDHGGFEGNGQTLRIVAKLEPYTANNGMNLTRRSMLGLIKYPGFIDQMRPISQQASIPANFRQLHASEWLPPKGLYQDDKQIFEWVTDCLSAEDKRRFCSTRSTTGRQRRTRYKSFDCSIMELADDIAYGIHDLEDAITTGIIEKSVFDSQVTEKLQKLDDIWYQQQATVLSDNLFSQHHYRRKDAIGSLVNKLITAISIQPVDSLFTQALLKYNATLDTPSFDALNLFKEFVLKNVIKRPDIQRLEYKGQQLIMQMFDAFASDPTRLLPANTCLRWQQAEKAGKGMRVICDYIAGMTDGYASRMHKSLFYPE